MAGSRWNLTIGTRGLWGGPGVVDTRGLWRGPGVAGTLSRHPGHHRPAWPGARRVLLLARAAGWWSAANSSSYCHVYTVLYFIKIYWRIHYRDITFSVLLNANVVIHIVYLSTTERDKTKTAPLY